jgi:hypothetical protein
VVVYNQISDVPYELQKNDEVILIKQKFHFLIPKIKISGEDKNHHFVCIFSRNVDFFPIQ